MPVLGRRVGTRTFLVVVTVVMALRLIAAAFLTPLATAPDEAAHVDLVFHLAEGNPYPEWDGRQLGQQAVSLDLTFRSYRTEQLGFRTEEKAKAVDFDRRYGVETPSDWPMNQMPQHPPLYYWGAATTLQASRAIIGRQSFVDEVRLLRLVNAALATAIPLLSYLTARRIGAGEAVARVSALFVLAVPQLVHVTSAVSNDALLNLFGAIAVWAGAGVIRGDHSNRTALILGSAAGLAASTKGFGLMIVAWTAACYLYSLRSTVREASKRRGLQAAVTSLGVAGLLGGGFWLRNVIVHGRIAPSTHANPVGMQHDPDLLAWGWGYTKLMVKRFWIDFGYHDITMGASLSIALGGVVVLAIVAALWPTRARDGDHRSTNTDPGALAMLCVMPFLLLAFVALRAWDLHQRGGGFPFIQSRYLYSGLLALAVTAAAGLIRMAGRSLQRWVGLAVVATAIGLDGHATWLVLDRWWGTPTDSMAESVQALVAWHPGTIPLFYLSVAGLVMALPALLVVVWPGPRGPRPDVGSSSEVGGATSPLPLSDQPDAGG